LQPGRHTYAFYTAAALATGAGVHAICAQGRARAGWLAGFAAIAAFTVLGWWYLQREVAIGLQARLNRYQPFLSSYPSSRLRWVISQVQRHVKPGERLIYEEGGFDVEGVLDPFRGGRLSGLIPYFVPGVELLGGPYLHAALKTNYTQVGEGRLFGEPGWRRDHFVDSARLYRPAAILCWSPWARRFCYDNPDLVEVVADEGTLLLGKVKGFGGMAIQGNAKVLAKPGVLKVFADSAELDGSLVLRYHFVPCLRANPPAHIHPVSMAGDPVPFIGLKLDRGVRSIEVKIAP
jgi:hypothetical protein